MKSLWALFFLILTPSIVFGEDAGTSPVKVGVPTILSGDFAELGQNIVNTVKTYETHYLRHPLKFEFEDAKISSVDGLKAYQKLINFSHAQVLIGATSSNGTMAGAPLINSSKTVMITPVTGGSNVDNAGDWIFRIGNSDLVNGSLQAQLLLQKGFTRIALLAEETEYTMDIAASFSKALATKSNVFVSKGTFAPATTDFRSQLTLLRAAKPQVIFIPTQTGTALALILNQLSQVGGFQGEIHTTFTAADNPDAKALAKGRFKGLHYLAPAYDKNSPRLKEFLTHYRQDHSREPLIGFHTAATVDALDLLQAFLDQAKNYDGESFKNYLLTINSYHGLMGTFSIDKNGNADTGFAPAEIH
jgi:branched-chain amino acid transport system substrate-binding protein